PLAEGSLPGQARGPHHRRPPAPLRGSHRARRVGPPASVSRPRSVGTRSLLAAPELAGLGLARGSSPPNGVTFLRRRPFAADYRPGGLTRSAAVECCDREAPH